MQFSKRFQLLVLQHWADNRKRYILSILAYVGVLILWFLVAMLAESHAPLDHGLQSATYYISLFALGTTFSSQYFNYFSSQAKGINYLLVPASHFEKLLCSLLYTVVFFLIVITVTFYMVDVPMTYVTKSRIPAYDTAHKYGVANVFDVGIFEFAGGPVGKLIFFYLSVQSIFLYGSVLFRKFSFLKTCIIGLVTCFLGFILLYFANKEAMDNDTFEVLPTWIRSIVVTFTFLTPPLFWVLTYFRLKAKQV